MKTYLSFHSRNFLVRTNGDSKSEDAFIAILKDLDVPDDAMPCQKIIRLGV